MNALAHFLEEAGIATTGISLIREHSQRMRPPRLLWVPFPLGRPLGRPNDAAFQQRVIAAALALLDEDSGPVLADFPEDSGSEASPPDAWSCPLPLPPPETGDDRRQRLRRELSALRPWYELARTRRGRTTFGASGLELEGVAELLLGFIEDAGRLSLGGAAIMQLKHATEDLKAFYLEAACAQPSQAQREPSPSALSGWLWGETEAGQLLRAVGALARSSQNGLLRVLGERALVPRGIDVEMHPPDSAASEKP